MDNNIASKKILLVEDDPFLIDIYVSRLKDSAFSVEVAENGEDGLRKVKEQNPDLLVLDLVLPKLDGWEVLEEIRRDAKFDNLKVIILSNLSRKEEIERGMQLGASKFLIKAHYTPTEIIEEIKKVLQ